MPGIWTLVAVDEVDDFAHAMAVMQLEHKRADEVVEPGALAAAGEDASAGFLRFEEQAFAWASDLE